MISVISNVIVFTLILWILFVHFGSAGEDLRHGMTLENINFEEILDKPNNWFATEWWLVKSNRTLHKDYDYNFFDLTPHNCAQIVWDDFDNQITNSNLIEFARWELEYQYWYASQLINSASNASILSSDERYFLSYEILEQLSQEHGGIDMDDVDIWYIFNMHKHINTDFDEDYITYHTNWNSISFNEWAGSQALIVFEDWTEIIDHWWGINIEDFFSWEDCSGEWCTVSWVNRIEINPTWWWFWNDCDWFMEHLFGDTHSSIDWISCNSNPPVFEVTIDNEAWVNFINDWWNWHFSVSSFTVENNHAWEWELEYIIYTDDNEILLPENDDYPGGLEFDMDSETIDYVLDQIIQYYENENYQWIDVVNQENLIISDYVRDCDFSIGEENWNINLQYHRVYNLIR